MLKNVGRAYLAVETDQAALVGVGVTGVAVGAWSVAVTWGWVQ